MAEKAVFLRINSLLLGPCPSTKVPSSRRESIKGRGVPEAEDIFRYDGTPSKTATVSTQIATSFVLQKVLINERY
jgi:hypothetical protein